MFNATNCEFKQSEKIKRRTDRRQTYANARLLTVCSAMSYYTQTYYFVTRFGGRIVANRCHSRVQVAQLGAYIICIYVYINIHDVTTFITMTSLSEGVYRS